MSNSNIKSALKPDAIDLEVVSDAPALRPAQSDAWQRVRRYADLAGLHLAASTAAQCMAGMDLIDLHKDYKGAGRRNCSTMEQLGTWDDALAAVGVTKTTAWRWMEMGKIARKRIAKGQTDLAALLQQPPGAWTEPEREALKQAVHKITDGATQSELLLEWGITKKPQGGGAKGGGKGAAKQEQNAEVIAEGRRVQTNDLYDALKEALDDHIWNAADEATRQKLHGLLIDAAADVKETLS